MRQKTIKQESKKITEFTYHTRSGIYSHMKNGWLSEEEIQMEVSSINKACLKSTGKRASKIIVHKTGGKEKPIPIVAYERIAENLEDFEALVKSTLKSSGLDKFVDISIFQHSKTAFLNVPSCEIFEISASPMRSGYGSRVLDLVARYADLGNIPLWLSVANESDDPFDFDDDDPEAPPSEDDLIRLYGKFGFRVVVSGSRTIMVRHPNAEN